MELLNANVNMNMLCQLIFGIADDYEIESTVNKKLIVLIGESASGKSKLEKMLCETGRFKKAISNTTRPMREGEVDGKDYSFNTEEKFEKMLGNGEFVEHTIYREWYYGVAKEEIFNSDIPVVLVVNPHGFRQLKENLKDSNIDIVSFYIYADKKTRLLRSLSREDKPDCLEICRRLLSDADLFKDIEEEVDYIIDNRGSRNIVEAWSEILQKLEEYDIAKNKK